MLDELVRFSSILRPHFRGVPFQFLPRAIRHIAEQPGLRHHRAVFEMAGRRPVGFARVDPFGVMADGVGDERRGRSEAGKLLLGQQHVLVVIREQHSLVAHE